MATIERKIDIAASAGRIWDLLQDVRRLPEYSASTLEVRDAPARLTAVGQEYSQVGRLLGVTMTSRWRVVAIDPGRLLSSEGSLAPGVRYLLTQRLDALSDSRTRLWVEIVYTVPGGPLGRLAARAGVEARAAREAEAVLEGIRATLETAD